MNTPIESTGIQQGESGGDPGRSSAVAAAARTRRKLIAGAVSSPLLLAVASRPAWAGGGWCSPSALASANLSGKHTFAGCSISAGWWKNFKNKWPLPATTPFHSIFAGVKVKGTSNVLYLNQTLGNVIDMSGGNDNNPVNLGMHLVAAYLNAQQFPTQGGRPGYPFTVAQVVSGYNALNDRQIEEFAVFKNSLETANNQFDAITIKPNP